MTLSRVDTVAQLASRHQVVAVLGARGTGKTWLAERLQERWAATHVTVLRLDAEDIREPAALLTPLAQAIGSPDGELSADGIPEGRTVRLLVDRAEQLYDRTWLATLQERLRALLSSEAARGRVGLVILGRPVFRKLVGGRASPLLNLGTTVGIAPLTPDELTDDLGVPADVAGAVHRKTGGHPELSEMLLRAIDGDLRTLGEALPLFVKEQERYLIHLAEDHGVGGGTLLCALLDGSGATSEQELIRAGFGASFGRGLDTLDDLIASGLVRRDGARRCSLAADILRQSTTLRTHLRSPENTIPTDSPEYHAPAAALLYLVENRLRTLVVDRLSRLDPLWWSTCVPEQLIAVAESRRRAEAGAPASADPLHPIMYLSLGEVIEILQYANNWDAVFRLATGRTKDILAAPRDMLIAVRNKIAHNRPVTKPDLEALTLGSRLLGLLDEHETTPTHDQPNEPTPANHPSSP